MLAEIQDYREDKEEDTEEGQSESVLMKAAELYDQLVRGDISVEALC